MNARNVPIHFEDAKSVAVMQERRRNPWKIAAVRMRASDFWRMPRA
jgi:hypothetical protein